MLELLLAVEDEDLLVEFLEGVADTVDLRAVPE